MTGVKRPPRGEHPSQRGSGPPRKVSLSNRERRGETRARGLPSVARLPAGVCGSAVALRLHQGAVFAPVFLPPKEAGAPQPLSGQRTLYWSPYFPVIPLQAVMPGTLLLSHSLPPASPQVPRAHTVLIVPVVTVPLSSPAAALNPGLPG